MISKESLKGYIYIEAYKQTHVKQAIDGIGNLRMGQWAQQVCIDFWGLIYCALQFIKKFHFFFVYM